MANSERIPPAKGVGKAAILTNSEDVELGAGALDDADGAPALGEPDTVGVADGTTTGAAVVPAADGVSSGAEGAMPDGAAGLEGATAAEVGMGSAGVVALVTMTALLAGGAMPDAAGGESGAYELDDSVGAGPGLDVEIVCVTVRVTVTGAGQGAERVVG